MKKFSASVLALAFVIFALGTSPAYAQPAPVVPEPSTWLLLGSGLGGYAAWRWFKSRQVVLRTLLQNRARSAERAGRSVVAGALAT